MGTADIEDFTVLRAASANFGVVLRLLAHRRLASRLGADAVPLRTNHGCTDAAQQIQFVLVSRRGRTAGETSIK